MRHLPAPPAPPESWLRAQNDPIWTDDDVDVLLETAKEQSALDELGSAAAGVQEQGKVGQLGGAAAATEQGQKGGEQGRAPDDLGSTAAGDAGAEQGSLVAKFTFGQVLAYLHTRILALNGEGPGPPDEFGRNKIRFAPPQKSDFQKKI